MSFIYDREKAKIYGILSSKDLNFKKKKAGTTCGFSLWMT